MGIEAILDDGTMVTLAPSEGATVQELTERLAADSLTGSAVPFDSLTLACDDGEIVPYARINKLEDKPA